MAEQKRGVCLDQRGTGMSAEEMQAVDVRMVDPDELVDIRDVVIDRKLPKEERIRGFVKQIKNPYCFRVGNAVVKVSFSENGPTLDECLKNLVLRA